MFLEPFLKLCYFLPFAFCLLPFAFRFLPSAYCLCVPTLRSANVTAEIATQSQAKTSP